MVVAVLAFCACLLGFAGTGQLFCDIVPFVPTPRSAVQNGDRLLQVPPAFLVTLLEPVAVSLVTFVVSLVGQEHDTLGLEERAIGTFVARTLPEHPAPGGPRVRVRGTAWSLLTKERQDVCLLRQSETRQLAPPYPGLRNVLCYYSFAQKSRARCFSFCYTTRRLIPIRLRLCFRTKIHQVLLLNPIYLTARLKIILRAAF